MDEKVTLCEVVLTKEIENSDEGHVGEFVKGSTDIYVSHDTDANGCIIYKYNEDVLVDNGREVEIEGQLYGMWESTLSSRKYIIKSFEKVIVKLKDKDLFVRYYFDGDIVLTKDIEKAYVYTDGRLAKENAEEIGGCIIGY